MKVDLQIHPAKDTSENTELLRAVFECAPDAILIVDTQGRITAVNGTAERLFGYQRDGLIGQSIELLIPARFRRDHPRYVKDYQAAPHSRPMGADLKLFGLRRDGTEFPVDVMLSSLPTKSETLSLAVVRDITQRRAIEQRLEQTQQHFRAIVEGARDYAIFMLDPEGNVVTWNPGAELIQGYSSEEIIGEHFSRFFSQEDRDREKPRHELSVAAAEGRYEDEGWRIRKDGSRFWANVLITALYDEQRQITGYSKLTRDLTDRRRAEEALLAELSVSVLPGLKVHQMLRAISSSMQRIVAYDYASIALLDQTNSVLYCYSLENPEEPAPETERSLAPETSPEATVLHTREALFLPSLERSSFSQSALQPALSAGVHAAWWLPLMHEDSVAAVLCIGVRDPQRLEHISRHTLTQMASQIALTIQGVNAARQLSAQTQKLQEEKRYLEEELRTEYSFEEIVGSGESLRRVLKQVETVASTDATVLILGETGTGKELIARAIHHLSPRSGHTFVKVNCSSIPTGLLESELFGHEKGAFTGAIQQRIGRLELAHEGTLFLDEIGDLPLELQPKLLRALQEKEIERLGGKRTIPVNFRLLAATHRDLARMVKEGQFRSDLYYRLKVFPILLPPLRQRREDIPELVNYFVAKHARRMNKRIEEIPEAVMSALVRWHWPGNIRELENFLERAVILTRGALLQAPLSELQDLNAEAEAPRPTLEAAERVHILQVLRECGGVIGGADGAAERLGIKRTTLNSRIKKLGIERREYL
jgi:formate hydrogenlyase transcriptional activator